MFEMDNKSILFIYNQCEYVSRFDQLYKVPERLQLPVRRQRLQSEVRGRNVLYGRTDILYRVSSWVLLP